MGQLHNLHHLTLHCSIHNDYDDVKKRYLTTEYFNHKADHLPHDQAKVIDLIFTKHQQHKTLYVLEIILETRDYGVIQVGSHLLGAFIRDLYSEQYCEDRELTIEYFKIHPMGTTTKGALIEWDETDNKPIIIDLADLADEEQ